MKKGSPRLPFSSRCSDSVSLCAVGSAAGGDQRQEDGRNFDGIVPPHCQTAIVAPTSALVSALVAAGSLNGESVIVRPLTSELTPCAVTVITPALLVEIEATYFEVALADSPQPH